MSQGKSVARRSVLKGVTALGLGALSKPASAARHVITINSPSQYRLAYQFSVSGDLWKRSQHAGGPNVGHESVTVDPEDDIDGQSVHGITQGGYDCYGFTGNLEEFDVADQGGGTDGCEHANVWIDGEAVSACELPYSSPPPRDNVITLNSPSDYRLAYQFSVSGDLWKRSQHAGGPDVSHEYVTADPEDDLDGNTVHGITQGGFDCYGFTGDITYFDIADQGGGTSGCQEANVWINARQIDACRLLS